jgi:hypothetical protein
LNAGQGVELRSSVAVLALAAAVLAGCMEHHPMIMESDVDSLRIGYAGDVAGTLPMARHYCAQYERVAHLIDSGAGNAYYKCEKPLGPPPRQ